MDPELREGYETGRRMLRRHDPTYYFAARRLPPDLRPPTHALYGFVRTADQIVDGPHRPPTPAARRAALDAWEAELHAGAESRSPVVRALADAGDRHRLPLGELRTYMRSMRIDCGVVRIASWEELVAYMDGSAGSVGRIMAPLLGVPPRPPGGPRAARPRVPAGELHARRARGPRAGPRLPARRGPRALRRVRGRPGGARGRAGAARAGGPRDRPRPRAVLGRQAGDRRRAAVGAARGSASPSGSTGGCSTASRRTGFDVLGRSPGVRVWHFPGAAREALR